MVRLLLALLLAGTLAACGPQADARTVVQVFLASRQDGDVDGALSVLAPDVVMNAPNEVQYRGGAQVRQWLEATRADYTFQLSQQPTPEGSEVSWRENLYSQTATRWVGEIEWRAQVTDLRIAAINGRVIRGASGIICPQCPPGTKI